MKYKILHESAFQEGFNGLICIKIKNKINNLNEIISKIINTTIDVESCDLQNKK